MIKLTRSLILIIIAFFVFSCGGPNFFFIRNTAISEAVLLKEECSRRNIQDPSISEADSLLSIAQRLSSEGEDKSAIMHANMAAARYHLTLVREEFFASRTKLNKTIDGKNNAEQKVEMYEQILSDIRKSRNP
ncbi:hypothetical protein QA601_11955 [Chitinispirillales bacterium ANBcel5]|uniref:hypothetical protein n=1 Tax=Cellulosispirillum alkaliphilum TaxID=3039283 RepID=UPI002A56FDD2|nr:hypothetical protein [Chitinispirillales bacterium ANBcel5]